MFNKTIRTEEKHYDYFVRKWYNYFKIRNAYGYLGHTHKEFNMYNFDVIASCGYNLCYKDLLFGKYKVRLIADLHIGIPIVDLRFREQILPLLKDKSVRKIIFLGDTFDLALTNNKEIVNNDFWKWYNNTDKKCVFIVGNHDINLLKENNLIRKKILENDKTLITREYYYRGKLFCHGDKFDPLTQYLGHLYIAMFKVYDYTGRFGYFMWNCFFYKIFKVVDRFFERKR